MLDSPQDYYSQSRAELVRYSPRSVPNTSSFTIPHCFSWVLAGLCRKNCRKKAITLSLFRNTVNIYIINDPFCCHLNMMYSTVTQRYFIYSIFQGSLWRCSWGKLLKLDKLHFKTCEEKFISTRIFRLRCAIINLREGNGIKSCDINSELNHSDLKHMFDTTW